MKALSHWTDMSPTAQDAYIAVQVLGYEYRARFPSDTAGYFTRGSGASLESIIFEELPAYTRDLTAAAEVLLWLKGRCGSIALTWDEYNLCWDCDVQIGGISYGGMDPESAALAICTAALRAVGKDN